MTGLPLRLYTPAHVQRPTAPVELDTRRPWAQRRFMSGPPLNNSSPKRLCFRFMGRLGNQMFQLAALVGIARSKGMVPVISDKNRLFKLFDLRGITVLDYDLCRRVKVHRNKRSCAYDEISEDFPSVKDTGLFGYYQSWRYFKDCFSEVRGLLSIKAGLKQLAEERLKALVREQHGDRSLVDTVLVAVHVRRGDLAGSTRAREHGYVVASADYIKQAMTYYRDKYGRVLFVVCSDHPLWPAANLPHSDTVFVSNQSAELDMTTLSLCDHAIMTVGSFGWWSAWLAGGDTVYPRQQYRPGSRLEKQFNHSDYFPPHWVAMD